MKRILVTGAGGAVGLQVIRFLLSEGKYDITALELKDKHVYKRLKRFKKRISIVYGDICDEGLMDALIKEQDVVIHLAGVLPHLANVRDELCKEIDLKGTKQIVNSIKNYNPECFLLYASTTSVYGKQNDYTKLTVNSKTNIIKGDYYSKYKLKGEEYIQNNLKKYSIFRLAYILSDPGPESLIYNVSPNMEMEFLSTADAGYAFSKAVEEEKKINKKIFNVSGGEKYRDNYYNFLIKIFKTYGMSIRFLSSYILADKNYYGGYYPDSDKLEEILKFRSKNLNSYYNSLNKYKNNPGRAIPRIFALPFISRYNRKIKKD